MVNGLLPAKSLELINVRVDGFDDLYTALPDMMQPENFGFMAEHHRILR